MASHLGPKLAEDWRLQIWISSIFKLDACHLGSKVAVGGQFENKLELDAKCELIWAADYSSKQQ